MTRSGPDMAKLWHEQALGGMDLLRAKFVRHSFVRHAHGEFVVAVFEQGAERFAAQGSTWVASAGSVLVIPPGVAHTGSAAGAGGWRYRAFYPEPSLLDRLAAELFRRPVSTAAVPLRQLRDAGLHRQLLEAHAACEGRAPLLERQERLMAALERLLTVALEGAPPASAVGDERLAVRRVREYLEACFAEEIDAADLAALTGLSPSHMLRAFHRQVGIPPHAYLTQVRLRHARRRLRAGEPAAQTAIAVGFVDQSHLIRRFRDALGVTPGQYAQESRKIQSPVLRTGQS
jgi:AraC-like DNA-binding protein